LNRATASGNVSPEPYIRLMVDVLLTTNEAFRITGGGVFLPLCFNHSKHCTQGISEKKHD
jgi:hypothetical protein